MALSSQGALGFPAPGKTFPNARVSASVQGDIAEFPNMASTDTTNPADGRKTICRLVQNNSGGALNAGVRCVVAANGYQVSGAAGADGTSYSSSISEIITTSYPNNVTTTKYFTLADLSTNPVITKQTLLFKWNKNN